MKTIFKVFPILLCLGILSPIKAQTVSIIGGSEFRLSIETLLDQKSAVKEYEQRELEEDIRLINLALKHNEITVEEAEEQKINAAALRAQNITDELAIIEAGLSLLQRNTKGTRDYYARLQFLKPTLEKADSLSENEEIEEEEEEFTLNLKSKDDKKKKDKRTSTGMFLDVGFNNAITGKQFLNNSPYKFGQSTFWQVGYEFRTKLIQSGWLRLNYGLALQFNGLNPINNQYFVKNGDQIELDNHVFQLNQSKLRLDNLVLPIHVEFRPFKGNKSAENVKIGLGGYAGFNYRDVQKIEYTVGQENVKSTTRNNYNINNLVYGLDAYLGWDWVTIYTKYDINPIFTKNTVQEHNVSAGLRFTF